MSDGSLVTRNAILSNSIYGNTKLGIDLGDDGVTPEQTGRPHVGSPNDLQNYPVLTVAATQGGQTGVVGTLNGSPTHRTPSSSSPIPRPILFLAAQD